MVKEIRLYIEGDASLREGFHRNLLRDIHDLCRQRHIRFHCIPCDSDGDTWKLFKKELALHPDAVCLLLVDADGPVDGRPRYYLRKQEGRKWPCKEGEDHSYHLMVQLMEAWFLADPEALRDYYGKDFQGGHLPDQGSVEGVPKQQVEKLLREATRGTSKGSYSEKKRKHSSELLLKIDPRKIRQRAPHFERLMSILESLVR